MSKFSDFHHFAWPAAFSCRLAPLILYMLLFQPCIVRVVDPTVLSAVDGGG
jgi:hypothetical protein